MNRFLALLLTFSYGLVSHSTTLSKPNEKDHCIAELEKLSSPPYTYKFVKSGLDYEIAEIPTVSNDLFYVRYYTGNGFSEINSKTGLCNSTSTYSKTGKNAKLDKNAVEKLLTIFKLRDNEIKITQLKVEAELAESKISRDKPLDPKNSSLHKFRTSCAAISNSLREYMETNGLLTKTATGVCADPNSPQCKDFINK